MRFKRLRRAFSGKSPMADFHPAPGLNAYGGGSVRDFDPIVYPPPRAVEPAAALGAYCSPILYYHPSDLSSSAGARRGAKYTEKAVDKSAEALYDLPELNKRLSARQSLWACRENREFGAKPKRYRHCKRLEVRRSGESRSLRATLRRLGGL